MPTTTLIDPQGTARDVDIAQAQDLINRGWRPFTHADVLAQAQQAATEADYGGAHGAIGALGAGLARGATLGGTDVAARAIGGDAAADTLRGLREENPAISTGADIAGALAPALLSGGATLPAGLVGEAGRGIAAAAGGGLRGALVGGAAEGALFGAGQGVSELALSQDPLTIEHAASTLSSNMLYGAAAGGVAGGVFKGAEIGLGAAKRALDRVIVDRSGERAIQALAGLDAGTAAAGTTDATAAASADLSGLDAKGLRAARDAELDHLAGVEAAQRTADRSSVVDDVLSYRQAVQDANPWLAITEGENAARLNTAKRALRNALDDPKGLRDNPAALGKPLRIEERALEGAIADREGIAAKLDQANAKIADDLEAQLPSNAAGEAPAGPPSDSGPVVVRKVGRREMEATLPSGETRKLNMGEREQDDFLAERLPAGFKSDGVAVSTSRDFSIQRGVPATPKAIEPNALYVVRPSELAERKLFGNGLETADRSAKEYVDSIENAWKDGKKLDPLTAYIKPDGSIYIEDGNHRLQAAARTDREVAVQFRDGSQYEAQRGAREIGERIRADLPKGAGSAPVAVPPGAAAADIELTGKAARRYAAYADVKVPKGGKLTIAADDARTFLAALRSGQVQGETRAALDKLPDLLEQNRALQQRLKAATAPATPRPKLASDRLAAIDAAEEALGARTAPPKAPPESSPIGGMLKLAAHAVPFGGLAEKAISAAGGLRKAIGAATERVAQSASTFLGKAAPAAGKAAEIAPIVATKVLAALRYGEPAMDDRGKPIDKPEPKTLPDLFRARTDEIKQQVQIDPDGSIQMKPAARAKMAAKLAGLGTIDPVAADRLESAGARRIAWLYSQIPRRPDLAGLPVGPDTSTPSDAAMRTWTRKAAAVEDPYGVLARASAGAKARVVPEEVMALRATAPNILNDYITQVIAGLPDRKERLPYPQRLALSMLTGKPLDPAMTPSVIREIQAMHAGEPGSAGGTMAPRPTPQFGSVKRSDSGTPAQRRQGVGL